MNTRKQALALTVALLVACSSGAIAAGTASGTNAVSGNGIGDAEQTDDRGSAADDAALADDRDVERDHEQQGATVTFENQTSDGNSVVVDEVTMASGGFVVIHDSTLLEGEVVGSVIGVSAFLGPGTHENVAVTLDEPLTDAETLLAMPHRDTNDNREYDFVETEGRLDVPYRTPDDEPVTDDAVVSLDGVEDEPAEEMLGDDERTVDGDRFLEILIERVDVFVIGESEAEAEPDEETEDEPNETDEETEIEAEPSETDEELTGPEGPTGPKEEDGDDGEEVDVDDEEAADEDADAVDARDEDGDSGQASVTFGDQTSDGDTIDIETATLPDGGFVAVYDSGLLEGQITASFRGVSDFHDPGTRENSEIELDESIEADETLIAVAHRDTNDNQEFDLLETEGEEDGPYRTADDQTVVDEAVVTAEDDVDGK
ncbi:DUF7282 domain-containing protein [Natrinema salsiterrestre]|uniref:DUF7282 domain-containing protein n=1 Tax=Natrinema salsiterrestre TaxID=2950540 RepID=A0A9Q4L2E0_9EURY|nr:hypothetical protein [Natrinema salsiterrestre]MDF9746916.1 hypothetical protein [Natrinema salsiterrestre]